MTPPDRHEVAARVAEAAATDPVFRDELLANPAAALESLLGLPIPDAVHVTVHEESLTDIHLVIPARHDDEIADDDLELVAGGLCWGHSGNIVRGEGLP